MRGNGRVCAAIGGLGFADSWFAEGIQRPLAVVRVVLDGPNHELWRPAMLGQLRVVQDVEVAGELIEASRVA